MSDQTDPRLAVLEDPDWAEWIDLDDDEALSVLLDDLDDADESAGIVRVDTNDETIVGRLAEVLAHSLDDEPYWSCVVVAKNILAALREAS